MDPLLKRSFQSQVITTRQSPIWPHFPVFSRTREHSNRNRVHHYGKNLYNRTNFNFVSFNELRNLLFIAFLFRAYGER